MSKVFYKATQTDGLSFHASPNGKRARYLPGDVMIVPEERRSPRLCSAGVIHASDEPGETLIGGSWPCRLFEVEGDPVVGPEEHKFGFYELRSLREIEAWRALGPNGQEVAAFIEALRATSAEQQRGVAATRDAAWAAARDATRAAARAAAWAAARDAARDAAWDATRAAALAVCSRDLITPEQFDLLYAPWELVIPAASLGSWGTLKAKRLG